MKLSTTMINDCYLIEGDQHWDDRGLFQELYSTDQPFEELNVEWKQTNYSMSRAKGVIRGIHWAPFRKLVTCVAGEISDVVVDLRPDSPTYLLWHTFILSYADSKQVLVPAGCGHGFYVREDHSSIVYLQEETYKPCGQKSWHFQSFGIPWPHAEKYILSHQDETAPPWPTKKIS